MTVRPAGHATEASEDEVGSRDARKVRPVEQGQEALLELAATRSDLPPDGRTVSLRRTELSEVVAHLRVVQERDEAVVCPQTAGAGLDAASLVVSDERVRDAVGRECIELLVQEAPLVLHAVLHGAEHGSRPLAKRIFRLFRSFALRVTHLPSSASKPQCLPSKSTHTVRQ